MNQPKAKVTIREVASAAGVSVSTVSRVLNDRVDVAPETAVAVRRVIEELGYASSMAARSLRSRTTGVVGLIVPDFWHPFTTLVIRGVSQVTVQGYDLLAYAGGRRNTQALANWEQQSVAQLNGSVTDGIIVVTPNAATYRTSFPVVAIDPHQAGTDFPAIIATNHQGMLDAMAYLISLGHRRIGFIGGRPNLQSAQQRLQGYYDGLAYAGIVSDPNLVVTGDYTRSTGAECAHRWQGEIKLSDTEQDEYLRQGCRFAGRCPRVMDVCRTTRPPDVLVDGAHVSCHLYADAAQANGNAPSA